MPLPPLAPSNTPRYFVDYTSMEIQHTVMFRTPSQVTDLTGFFEPLIDAMVANMRIADQVLQIRFAAEGSDVTFPVVVVSRPGELSNASAIADDPESVFISTPFRGNPSGRKGRYDFFFSSSVIPLDLNNRFPWNSVETLGPLETQLQLMANDDAYPQTLCDIGKARIVFNAYWNRAKSAYWQRKQRLG